MDSLILKVLPFTGGRYRVSSSGKVFDSLGNELHPKVINNRATIKLSWYDGLREYNLGLIVLSAFEQIDHGDEVFNAIRVFHKDDDLTNHFPTNLSYVFTKPIESRYPGFFLIPRFRNYGLARDGRLINLKTMEEKTWTISKDDKYDTTRNRTGGYRYCVLYSDNGYKSTVHLHRLLMLVFNPPIGNASKLTVNHKDGDKNNNSIENLEWASYSENNKHAWESGLKLTKRPRILMRDLLSEKIVSFRSNRECARYLGEMNSFYISERLKETQPELKPDCLVFKYDDGTLWNLPDIKSIASMIGQNNDIIVRNVFTGNLSIFSNAQEASEHLNIPGWIILEHARNLRNIPYRGYNFRYLATLNKSLWPEHSKRHLQIYEKYPEKPRDGVICKDTTTGNEVFYVSTDDCCEKMKIAKTHLNTLIFTGRLFEKKYSFSLFKIRESFI